MSVIHLVTLSERANIRVLRKLGTIFAAISVFLLGIGVSFCLIGLSEIGECLAGVVTIMSPATGIMLFNGLRHAKISQSTVSFSSDCICVRDERGRTWRTIPYHAITSVKKEKIAGAFHGHNREQCVADYICIYLNGLMWTPDGTHYTRLFQMENFLPIAYDADAYNYLCEKVRQIGMIGIEWEADS